MAPDMLFTHSCAFCSGSMVLGSTVLSWIEEMALHYGALEERAEGEVQLLSPLQTSGGGKGPQKERVVVL